MTEQQTCSRGRRNHVSWLCEVTACTCMVLIYPLCCTIFMKLWWFRYAKRILFVVSLFSTVINLFVNSWMPSFKYFYLTSRHITNTLLDHFFKRTPGIRKKNKIVESTYRTTWVINLCNSDVTLSFILLHLDYQWTVGRLYPVTIWSLSNYFS